MMSLYKVAEKIRRPMVKVVRSLSLGTNAHDILHNWTIILGPMVAIY